MLNSAFFSTENLQKAYKPISRRIIEPGDSANIPDSLSENMFCDIYFVEYYEGIHNTFS